MKRLISLILCAAACLSLTACSSEARIECYPRIYRMKNSETPIPPSVTLMEDGTFSLHFSALSSYIGLGEYRIEGNRLLLETYDGDFHYTFDIGSDELYFDADNSSEMVWFSDMKDGALFE